jgi:hypothetical protein
MTFTRCSTGGFGRSSVWWYLFIKDFLPSFVKMAAFWAEMGVAYLEINKLPCLHEIDILFSIKLLLYHKNDGSASIFGMMREERSLKFKFES